MVASTRLDAPEELANEVDAGPSWTESTLVARAYLRWGDRFAEYLSGDFAVVVWDRRERRLLACRDPFGVKFLFYRRATQGVWVSPDQQALLGTFDGVPALDDDRVVEHLLGIFSATDRTYFRDIHPVPPGQTVVFRRGATETRTHWIPPSPRLDRKSPQPTPQLLEEIRHLFRRSVANRLRDCSSAVVHVSGGVDSSAIAVVADRIRSESARSLRLVGANARYSGLSCDEGSYVEALGGILQFAVHRWDGTHASALDLTSPAMDGPSFHSAFTDGTLGDVEIAQGCRASVILSGTGGDEMTVGFGTAKDMVAHREWTRAARRVLFYPGPDGRNALSRLRVLASQYLPPSTARRRSIRRFAAPAWLTPTSRGRVGNIVGWRPALRLDSAAATFVWNRLNSPQLLSGIEALQRQAMPHRIEYRFPFLDRELVRLVVTAAAGYWPCRTRPHQRALQLQLPAVIGNRSSKADLTPAFANRIRRATPLIERQFADGEWASARYVERDAARVAWRTFNPSTADGLACRRIWSIVTLEAWLRRVFGYISPS